VLKWGVFFIPPFLSNKKIKFIYNMENIIKNYNIINFENNKIIVIIDNNKIIWFNAKQISISLKYKEPKKAITKYVEKEDKIQLKNIDINFKVYQQPDSIYINESGLNSLLILSRTKKSKKFLKWITKDVLPLMRKNKLYSNNDEITLLQKKINELEHQNKLLKNDMKIEKFPEGAIVYVVEDFDINQEIIYKIGKTDDMNKRIKIYNTHSIHNKQVIYYVEIKCPLQLETCLKSMLYKYRIKNRKDFFNCTLIKIKKAFNVCINSIKCIENPNLEQNGGTIDKITYYQYKLNKLYNQYTISTID
jgi:prophage antirepressor-like protein